MTIKDSKKPKYRGAEELKNRTIWEEQIIQKKSLFFHNGYNETTKTKEYNSAYVGTALLEFVNNYNIYIEYLEKYINIIHSDSFSKYIKKDNPNIYCFDNLINNLLQDIYNKIIDINAEQEKIRTIWKEEKFFEKNIIKETTDKNYKYKPIQYTFPLFESIVLSFLFNFSDNLDKIKYEYFSDYIGDINSNTIIKHINSFDFCKTMYIFFFTSLKEELSNLAIFIRKNFAINENKKEVDKNIILPIVSAVVEKNNNNLKKHEYKYSINTFEDLCNVSIYHLLENNNDNIVECSNCHKLFIPQNRSDTLYCTITQIYFPGVESVYNCKEYHIHKKEILDNTDNNTSYKLLYERIRKQYYRTEKKIKSLEKEHHTYIKQEELKKLKSNLKVLGSYKKRLEKVKKTPDSDTYLKNLIDIYTDYRKTIPKSTKIQMLEEQLMNNIC